jgi:succinoglycan biosynthesis protein ExoV
VQLVYYQGTVANFGDDINRFIWPTLAPGLFEKAGEDGFLGIGTIIGMPTKCRHLHVFSSGVGYDALSRWLTPRTIWCVRGPLTAKLLACPSETALTDGAILAPLTLPDRLTDNASAGVGVIPHWESLKFPGWQDACAMAGMTLISPIASPVDVRNQLLSVKLVIAESLHGAILADTYGIPWVTVMSSRNFSIFKWKDWTMSLDLPLDVMALPPPAATPLLHFGRPAIKRWGQVVGYDEDAALQEVSSRIVASSIPSGSGRSFSARLKQSSLAARVLGQLLSFSPARTAEMLTQAARRAPNLSRPARRESLRQQMLDRLSQLCRADGVEIRL